MQYLDLKTGIGRRRRKKDWHWDHLESLMMRNGTKIIKAEKRLIPF